MKKFFYRWFLNHNCRWILVGYIGAVDASLYVCTKCGQKVAG